jgi:chemotaxis signal transduction protein
MSLFAEDVAVHRACDLLIVEQEDSRHDFCNYQEVQEAASFAHVQFESGRRLCLLFEAAGVRYGVEATSVIEIATPDPDGRAIRGFHELVDISRIVGGAPEPRPTLAVVLDTSPTLALRIARVFDVVDVSGAPFYMLPPRVAKSVSKLVRGAVLHAGRLHLELAPEVLGTTPPSEGAAMPARVPLDAVPERALVFESHGQRFGIPLALVSQVVPSGDAFCPLPARDGAVMGLFPYSQVVWPVYSVARAEGNVRSEELVILTELAGQSVGLSAARILGVFQGFVPTDTPGELTCRELEGATVFLDLQQMFS